MHMKGEREGNGTVLGGIRRMWNATRASWMWQANKVSLNRRTECKYLTLMLVKQCTSCSPLSPALSPSLPLFLSLTVSGKLNGLLCRRDSPYYSLWRLHSYWFDVALYFCVFSFCLNSILVHCTFCDGRKCDRADDGRCKWMRGEQGRDIEGMLGGGRGGTSRQFANSCSQQSAKKCYSRWADCQLATRGETFLFHHFSPFSPPSLSASFDTFSNSVIW